MKRLLLPLLLVASLSGLERTVANQDPNYPEYTPERTRLGLVVDGCRENRTKVVVGSVTLAVLTLTTWLIYHYN